MPYHTTNIRKQTQMKPNRTNSHDTNSSSKMQMKINPKKVTSSMLQSLSSLHTSLKCPLCHKMLSNPATLPCTHSFCIDCIEEYEKHNWECPVSQCGMPISFHATKVRGRTRGGGGGSRAGAGTAVSSCLRINPQLDTVVTSLLEVQKAINLARDEWWKDPECELELMDLEEERMNVNDDDDNDDDETVENDVEEEVEFVDLQLDLPKSLESSQDTQPNTMTSQDSQCETDTDPLPQDMKHSNQNDKDANDAESRDQNTAVQKSSLKKPWMTPPESPHKRTKLSLMDSGMKSPPSPSLLQKTLQESSSESDTDIEKKKPKPSLDQEYNSSTQEQEQELEVEEDEFELEEGDEDGEELEMEDLSQNTYATKTYPSYPSILETPSNTLPPISSPSQSTKQPPQSQQQNNQQQVTKTDEKTNQDNLNPSSSSFSFAAATALPTASQPPSTIFPISSSSIVPSPIPVIPSPAGRNRDSSIIRTIDIPPDNDSNSIREDDQARDLLTLTPNTNATNTSASQLLTQGPTPDKSRLKHHSSVTSKEHNSVTSTKNIPHDGQDSSNNITAIDSSPPLVLLLTSTSTTSTHSSSTTPTINPSIQQLLRSHYPSDTLTTTTTLTEEHFLQSILTSPSNNNYNSMYAVSLHSEFATGDGYLVSSTFPYMLALAKGMMMVDQLFLKCHDAPATTTGWKNVGATTSTLKTSPSKIKRASRTAPSPSISTTSPSSSISSGNTKKERCTFCIDKNQWLYPSEYTSTTKNGGDDKDGKTVNQCIIPKRYHIIGDIDAEHWMAPQKARNAMLNRCQSNKSTMSCCGLMEHLTIVLCGEFDTIKGRNQNIMDRSKRGRRGQPQNANDCNESNNDALPNNVIALKETNTFTKERIKVLLQLCQASVLDIGNETDRDTLQKRFSSTNNNTDDDESRPSPMNNMVFLIRPKANARDFRLGQKIVEQLISSSGKSHDFTNNEYPIVNGKWAMDSITNFEIRSLDSYTSSAKSKSKKKKAR